MCRYFEDKLDKVPTTYMRFRFSKTSLPLTLAFLSALAATGCLHSPLAVRSPNGINTIELFVPGDGRAEGLGLNISRAGAPILEIDSLTVRLAERGALSGAAKLLGVERSRTDEKFPTPTGKTSFVLDRSNRVTVRLADAQGVKWNIDLAAYDDGVAFRYSLPEQDGLAAFTLTEESAAYRFSGAPTLHYSALENFTTDHEMEFKRGRPGGLTGPLIDLPFLAVWPDGSAAALTEARIRDFTALNLEPVTEGGSQILHSRLSPLPKGEKGCVIGKTPHSSPWRVLLLGENAGRLLESTILLCLNDPPSGDFSWAKPGKTTWHWWNGTFDHDPTINPGMNLETHKRYIDFCARNGIAFHAVIADAHPWHVQSKATFGPGPDTDILTPRPELHLPEILSYARERGVGIRLWVHWKALDPRLEDAFTQYEKWGVSGLMIDFLDRDDQRMVQFCERAVESATRHKLHLQFHGSYKPSGEQRTFPNLFNREGVLNLEYLKWSKLTTPPHNIEVAYVRALAGPLDYHLGGFRSISNDKFVARSENPFVLGTRCHHLAMYVVYENPMPQVCDTPEAYDGQTGFDFIVEVPTTWDETRFVAGDPGDWIVMARRKGPKWYVGGMTNWTARKIDLPLTFLGPGSFEARLYVDGSMNEEEPNSIRAETRAVGARESIPISMAPGGGFTAVIAPK